MILTEMLDLVEEATRMAPHDAEVVVRDESGREFTLAGVTVYDQTVVFHA